MPDNADLLLPRGILIADALRDVPTNQLWRWKGRKPGGALRINAYKDSGKLLDYRRKDDKKATIILNNVRAAKPSGLEYSEAIPTGPAKSIDAQSATLRNNSSIEGAEQSYRGMFGETKGREDALRLAFSQKSTTEITAEYSGVEVKQSIELGFEQETTATTSQESNVEREVSWTVPIPAYTSVRVWGTRQIQPMKIKVSGFGDLDHGIEIGKHWSGKWNDKAHGGKRHAKWDSFAEFLKVIKGDGARDQDLWEWFRNNPVNPKLLAKLEKPLDVPFAFDAPFDDVTNTKLVIDQL